MLPVKGSERCDGDRLIQFGDLVVVYEKFNRMKAVTVSVNGELQNRYGLFLHNDWIGKPFGSKVFGKKGGFVYLLAPSPQLWTLVLTHRTQILYIADISFVIAYLEVRPGSVVMESGTGSGSFTTALAMAAAPNGHVHSFDFHEQRVGAARNDFVRNGLSSMISVSMRDIQGEGFPPEFADKVDAVFLDLPQPWLAIPSVAVALRGDASVCSFSPCIEQVQRTCVALSTVEFTGIRTFEVLLRTYEVHEQFLSTDLGISSDSSSIPVSSPPQKRICSSDVTGQEIGASNNLCKKHFSVNCQDCHIVDLPHKGASQDPGMASVGKSKRVWHKVGASPGTRSVVTARPEPETKGHTGYLTFARRAV